MAANKKNGRPPNEENTNGLKATNCYQPLVKQRSTVAEVGVQLVTEVKYDSGVLGQFKHIFNRVSYR